MGFLFQIFSFFFTNNPVRTQGSKHFSGSPACDFSDPSDLLNLRFRWRILSGKRGAFLNWKPSFWGTHKGILQKKKGWKKFQFHIIPNGLIVIFIPWDPFFPKKKSPKKQNNTPQPDREVGHDIGETPNEWKLPTNHLPLGMVFCYLFQVMLMVGLLHVRGVTLHFFHHYTRMISLTVVLPNLSMASLRESQVSRPCGSLKGTPHRPFPGDEPWNVMPLVGKEQVANVTSDAVIPAISGSLANQGLIKIIPA